MFCDVPEQFPRGCSLDSILGVDYTTQTRSGYAGGVFRSYASLIVGSGLGHGRHLRPVRGMVKTSLARRRRANVVGKFKPLQNPTPRFTFCVGSDRPLGARAFASRHAGSFF